ncbi:orotidine 5'-phosphate decarboxylase [Candidatus Woesearchaeota archaeon]|nr:orotidine 5'-phosphate decarboxylase [Candidatus Woesearchaeota archaeon]
MNKQPFLFVGLDYENPSQVAEFAEELAEVDRNDFGFKLNLDFYINCALLGDTRPLARVARLGKPTFADLKMWNGKRTMSSVADCLKITHGAEYFNVYAMATDDFLRRVVDCVSGTNIKVLGITVLTHYNDDYCRVMRGGSLRETVRKDAEIAYNAGCHGIILPGSMLKEVADLEIQKLIPAVRPSWYGKTGDNYQEQETYVRDAVKNGADLLVCSSPIRKSKDRKEALVRTLDEMY